MNPDTFTDTTFKFFLFHFLQPAIQPSQINAFKLTIFVIMPCCSVYTVCIWKGFDNGFCPCIAISEWSRQHMATTGTWGSRAHRHFCNYQLFWEHWYCWLHLGWQKFLSYSAFQIWTSMHKHFCYLWLNCWNWCSHIPLIKPITHHYNITCSIHHHCCTAWFLWWTQ